MNETNYDILDQILTLENKVEDLELKNADLESKVERLTKTVEEMKSENAKLLELYHSLKGDSLINIDDSKDNEKEPLFTNSANNTKIRRYESQKIPNHLLVLHDEQKEDISHSTYFNTPNPDDYNSNVNSLPRSTKSIKYSFDNFDISSLDPNFSKLKLCSTEYSDIYLEKDAINNKLIVAKYFPEKSSTDKRNKYKKDAETEIKLSKGLNHINISNIIDYDDKLLRKTYNYEEGGNLKNLLYLNNISKNFKLHLIKGIANGLNYLHSNKLVHGDLRCTNILLDKKFNNDEINYFPVPKISNFIFLTKEGSSFRAITHKFSAPEIINGYRNKKDVKTSVKIDIYSFGMTMYEIISGENPLNILSDDKADDFIINGGIPDIDKLDSLFGVKNIIFQCLNKDPNKRPSSKEIVDMLSNINEL